MWHYIRNGQQGGPVGEDELRAMLAQGRLGLQDLVWREGNGYTSRGIAQLLITLLGFWLLVPILAVIIWNIIEAITVDRDASGRALA